MSALKKMSQRYPKLSSIIGTVICVAIGWERAKSFAEAQQPALNNRTEEAPQTAKLEYLAESSRQDGGASTPPSASEPTTVSSVEKIDLPLAPSSGATPKPKPTVEKKNSKTSILQTIPLEHRALQKFGNIKTKQQACQVLEGKVVTYYDSATYVVNCIQRPIEDGDVLNALVFKMGKPVAEVPAHIYRLLPFGEPWVSNQEQNSSIAKICRELNGRYVTSTGADYYYIDGCKKRSFSNYVELQAHNKRNAPILMVPPDQVDKIPNGRSLEGNYDKEVGALYKIIGESSVSTLGNGSQNSKPVGSAEDLDSLPKKSKKSSDTKDFCKQYNKKVVSFYSQLFYISQCQKRPIKELPIAIQQRFSEQGSGIIDVSSHQLDSIPTGRELSEDEAVELML